MKFSEHGKTPCEEIFLRRLIYICSVRTSDDMVSFMRAPLSHKKDHIMSLTV